MKYLGQQAAADDLAALALTISGAAATDLLQVQTVDGSGRPTAYGNISFSDAAAAIIALLPNGMEVAW